MLDRTQPGLPMERRFSIATINFNEMENQISNWNGFKVHGDTSELDKILKAEGFINVDKHDIEFTLSADDDNYVVSAVSHNIIEALKSALAKLAIPHADVHRLFIQFYCGSYEVQTHELSRVVEILTSLNEHADIGWSIARETTLEDKIKVVLLCHSPNNA